MGDGIIGVAARERVPIRIGHMTAEYSYGAAVREQAQHHGLGDACVKEIEYPGSPRRKARLPFRFRGLRLSGYSLPKVPSRCASATRTKTRLLSLPAGLANGSRRSSRRTAGLLFYRAAHRRRPQSPGPRSHPPLSADDSVFLDHDYLIKGVAGAIFWKLARAMSVRPGRVLQPRASPRPCSASAGTLGEPRGAAGAAPEAPFRAEPDPDRKMRAGPVPACRALRLDAGGGGNRGLIGPFSKLLVSRRNS